GRGKGKFGVATVLANRPAIRIGSGVHRTYLVRHGADRGRGPEQRNSCEAGESAYLRGMDWQQLASLAIVGATAAIFVWQRFRPRKFSLQRDTYCGCSTSGHSRTPGGMVFRARRGERPQIMIKL